MTDSANSIITIRVIKSFEYRTAKNIILHVDLSTLTVGNLKQQCLKEIKEKGAFIPYRNVQFDTMKIHSHAFGTKTQNLIINIGDEGFLSNDSDTLAEAGVLHETDISFFNMEAYEAYAKNPQMKW